MIKQTRHRSFHKFLNKIRAGIIANPILPKKPAVKMYDISQLIPLNYNYFSIELR